MLLRRREGKTQPRGWPFAGMKGKGALATTTQFPAMSSIAPQRPAGVRWRTRSCRPVISCRARRVSAVSIQPGSTALTWMLSCAQAEAHALVNCTIPPLEAAYAGAKPAPKIDIIEPMLMILPRPVAFIAGYAACEQR